MKSHLPLHHELPLSGLDGDIGRGVDGADPSSDVEPGEGALETTEKKKKKMKRIFIITYSYF